MSTSTRLAVATHVLTTIALAQGDAVTSDLIAQSANTNPTFIRRLLMALTEAGLTTSQMGKAGGALLARPAARITLLDVYRAVDDPSLFSLHHGGPNPRCPIGKNIKPILERELGEAARSMEGALAKTTIADIARDIVSKAEPGSIERLLN